MVTTEFVLLEVADALSSPDFRLKAVAFLNGLRALTVLKIIPASSALFAAGWNLYSQRSDKEWSLNASVTLQTLDRAARALGKRLRIKLA